MKEITLKVEGMQCGMCESHVNDTVRKAANVKKVTSSHVEGKTVVICEDNVDVDVIKTQFKRTATTSVKWTSNRMKRKACFRSSKRNKCKNADF